MSLWKGLVKGALAKIGQIGEGNYFEVEADGTIVFNGNATVWDELSQPFVGQNIAVVAGRVDYNYTELTLDYATNARYPNEPVGIVVQLQHAMKAGSDIKPHIHWIQEEANQPNILIAYRFYSYGSAVPGTWTLKALTSSNNKFAYPGSGNIQQITEFDLPAGIFSAMGLSFTFDCKIYRDSLNTSGLFAGADPYTVPWRVKYYDIHFEKDMLGSRTEYVK